MKKLISLLSVFFLSTAGYAANKIEMVTYFPVPYVAYSRVQVDKILDIGLTNVCNMSLGCTESGNAGLRPLHVQDAYLETGSLDLTRALAVRSNNISLGVSAGEANIDFNDSLRVKNLNDGYSLETGQLTVDALKLFPNRIVNNFPSCAATGAAGAPQVSWQKLKIKGKEETFLVCGSPKEYQDCTDPVYKSSHKSVCCPGTPETDSVCWKKALVYTGGTQTDSGVPFEVLTRDPDGNHNPDKYAWCRHTVACYTSSSNFNELMAKELEDRHYGPFCGAGDPPCPPAGQEVDFTKDPTCTTSVCTTGKSCTREYNPQNGKEWWRAYFTLKTRSCSREYKSVPNGW